MLLDYFGLWFRAYSSGSAGAKGVIRGKPGVVVVSYAGKEYRVPVGELTQFLAKLREPPKVAEIQRKRVRKNKKAQYAPVVALVEAPEDEIPQIQLIIDTANEKMHYVWGELLKQKLLERDDEETLLILMGAL